MKRKKIIKTEMKMKRKENLGNLLAKEINF
jgi:hypothetical protein